MESPTIHAPPQQLLFAVPELFNLKARNSDQVISLQKLAEEPKVSRKNSEKINEKKELTGFGLIYKSECEDSPRFIGNSQVSFDDNCKCEPKVDRINDVMSISKFCNGKQHIFSCMDFYEQEQTPELVEVKKKYERRSRRNKTLVFEMQNTMIKVLDPATDEFNLIDQALKKLTVETDIGTETMFARFFPDPLVKVLQQF